MMIDAAQKLERGGADFIVICTNTMHMFANEIAAAVNIPIVHIGDATAKRSASGTQESRTFGNEIHDEQDFLKGRLADNFQIETIIPDDADRETVHSIIYNELVKGEINDKSRAKYLEIIEKLLANGAEGVILGCTEIPLLVSNENTDAILFDTTMLHAEKTVEVALN